MVLQKVCGTVVIPQLSRSTVHFPLRRLNYYRFTLAEHTFDRCCSSGRCEFLITFVTRLFSFPPLLRVLHCTDLPPSGARFLPLLFPLLPSLSPFGAGVRGSSTPPSPPFPPRCRRERQQLV